MKLPARGCLKPVKWGCGCMFLFALALVGGVFLLLNRVPKSYPPPARPMPAPAAPSTLGGGLDGFDSPYLGHTGSWDGKGGSMGGGSKIGAMDAEASMGLRWTFMPVNWRAMEPDGPVDLAKETPPAWRELDAFIIAAHDRKLNVLMQAPVIGGNAGGPPAWAGRRERGKSAPLKMEAAAEFAGKLATRYAPGGTLAVRQAWQHAYGVRAWELDNEPNGYRTHWKDQAADYAEFVTRSAAAIRRADPQAVILAPAANIGKASLAWIQNTLDAPAMRGSPEFKRLGQAYSIGPITDVVSFHVYEGLDSALSSSPRTVEVVFGEVRDVFEAWENRAPGFTYPRKLDYWHTEGNFDFLGVLSRERRAAWRVQFLTRAFAAGVRKVMVMDASAPEQAAVRAYIRALPNPFPMERVNERYKVVRGTPVVFRHQDTASAGARSVWVLWAVAGTGAAEVELADIGAQAKTIQIDGKESLVVSTNGSVLIHLGGDQKMPPPLIVISEPPARPRP